jgi:hopanoid biosynthesis associated radical SAM protein HpnH
MRYPLRLIFDSAKHLATHKLRGGRKFAVMLTLDPLGGCAGACGGSNGRNGQTASQRRTPLSVEQCLAAMEECDAPVVTICGGEPLEYEGIAELTRAILDRGKHLFLCTDGTLIRQCLHMIPPKSNFFWNVKLDGTEGVHDSRVGKPGQFTEALDGVKAAKNAGFFVVVTSTVYPDSDVRNLEALYAKLHGMHADGYRLAPLYLPGKVCRDASAKFYAVMHQRFTEISDSLSEYNLLVSPVYLEYLRGERELDCSVWGSPVYGPGGWSSPCYLLNYSLEKSYKALLEDTLWENFGRGLNPRCETCSCYAGFETAAMLGVNRKAGDTWKMLAWQFGGGLGEKRESVRKP